MGGWAARASHRPPCGSGPRSVARVRRDRNASPHVCDTPLLREAGPTHTGWNSGPAPWWTPTLSASPSSAPSTRWTMPWSRAHTAQAAGAVVRVAVMTVAVPVVVVTDGSGAVSESWLPLASYVQLVRCSSPRWRCWPPSTNRTPQARSCRSRCSCRSGRSGDRGLVLEGGDHLRRVTVSCVDSSGSSSVGRALAFQAGCREFESRLPLHSSPLTCRLNVSVSVESPDPGLDRLLNAP